MTKAKKSRRRFRFVSHIANTGTSTGLCGKRLRHVADPWCTPRTLFACRRCTERMLQIHNAPRVFKWTRSASGGWAA